MGKGKYIVEENPYGFLMGMHLNKGMYIEVQEIILATKKVHSNHWFHLLPVITFQGQVLYCRYYISSQPESEGTSVKVGRSWKKRTTKFSQIKA